MYEQQPSAAKLTDAENGLKQRLLEGDSSEPVNSITEYLNVKDDMFAYMQDVMNGYAGPLLKADTQLRAMAGEVADYFSSAVQTEPDYDAKIEYAATLLHDIFQKFIDIDVQFCIDEEQTLLTREDLKQMTNARLENEPSEVHAECLEKMMKGIFNEKLDRSLAYGMDSKEDARRFERNMLLAKAKEAATAAAKIALAATVFAVVNRLADKR